MQYVTAAQMKEIDKYAIEECGIPAIDLMENAGRAVAVEAEKLVSKGRAAVFCGYGNNGGDGLVAARFLFKDGYDVTVFFIGKPKSLSPETNSNLEKILTLGLKPEFISKEEEISGAFEKLGKPDVVIDAIFGIGIKGKLEDFYINVIGRMNSADVPIISADVPSGLDADTGSALPVAVKARATVTFGHPKAGFKSTDAEKYLGNLIVADIGFPQPGASRVKAPRKEKSVRLRTGRKGIVKSGHPWIFKQQLLKTDAAIKPGDIIKVFDASGKFMGRGYYNPRSDIAIRMFTGSDEVIDDNFISDKIKKAAGKRDKIAALTNAYRVVFSEADGLPGLIIDTYRDTAVFQMLTLGMDKLKPLVLEGIRQVLVPAYIYEKSVSPFRKLEGLKDVASWHGGTGSGLIEISEGKAKFLVDIEKGHKTGFYLDQRKSRMAIGDFCKNKKVLDLFCYTGGFSVWCALGGAEYTRGIDIKEDWLSLGRKNAALNGVGGKIEFMKADAFEAVKKACDSGEKFDIIIVDPPSFLKNRESLASASKGYAELNLLAMKALAEGGILATFSCSHNMPNAAFSAILKDTAAKAGKKMAIIKRCHQAEDHPIVKSIPETEYLKGYFLKINSL